ncbi:MAG: shikimate kinase [Betaproteobacteria bacterium]|nr:shikimate kinase [Betaproteobacteria bacterium]
MTVVHNIFLIGMPGAGKSTVGKALARRCGLRFLDCDHEIERRTGVAIATIFEIEGEAGFREREAQLIAEVCAGRGLVLATGGGVILREDNRRTLREHGLVVFLQTRLADLVIRTRRDTKRPLLQGDDPAGKLRALMEAREPLYHQAAHLVFDAATHHAGRMADLIIERMAQQGYTLELPPTQGIS